MGSGLSVSEVEEVARSVDREVNQSNIVRHAIITKSQPKLNKETEASLLATSESAQLMFIERKAESFAKESLLTNMDMEAVRCFLRDPSSLHLYKQYLTDKIDAHEAALVFEDLESLNIDGVQPSNHLNRMEPFLMISTFRQFVESKYFSQWLAVNRALVSDISCNRMTSGYVASSTSTGLEDDVALDIINVDDISALASTSIGAVKTAVSTASATAPSNGNSLQSSFKGASRTIAANTYAHIAISYLGHVDFSRIVCSESWLSSLLAAAESLPVPFSITAVNMTAKISFPLIYVNPRFEALTGYPRTEIHGRNCRFLQQCNDLDNIPTVTGVTPAEFVLSASNANERKLVRLRQVLAVGGPATIELINYRKNGTPFRNYMLLKPLFDQHKRYRYVIGLQFEVDVSDEKSQERKLANRNLFNLLPDQIIVDDEVDEDLEAFK